MLLAENKLVDLTGAVLLVVVELVLLVECHRLEGLILLRHELQLGARIRAVLTSVHFETVLVFEVLANDIVSLLNDEFDREAPLLRRLGLRRTCQDLLQVRDL